MLFTQSCFNTWIVSGKEITDILFYRDGKVIASTQHKWLALRGKYCMTYDIKAIDEITEIRNCRKIDFKKNDVFFDTVNRRLYIPADLLNVTPEEERVARRDEESGEIWYGTFFDIEFTENGEKKQGSVMHPTYDRRELTAKGKQIDDLYNALKQLDDRISRSTAEAMLSNRESFITLLKGA